MLLPIIWISLGVVLLVAGGELLLRGAVRVATLLRITPAVIGLTVVAAGTSVPELAVSVIAAWRGSSGITVGNVVGSNIFNILVVVGATAAFRPLVIHGNTIRFEYPAMTVTTGIAMILTAGGSVARGEALLMLLLYVGFTALMIRFARRASESELRELGEEVDELAAKARTPGVPSSAVMIAGGVALLAGGAHATVTGAVDLARLLGISERVIGLTIIAGGTSLPEVVTSLVSAYRGRDDVAVGNVVGSNVFNLLGILGLSAIVAPLPVPAGIVRSDNWWMLGTTVLLYPMIVSGHRVRRLEGVLLLAVYGVYLALLFRSTAG